MENRLVKVTEDLIVEEINVKPKQNVSWFTDNWRAILSEFVSTTSLLLIGCMTCVPIDGLPMNPPIYSTLGFGLVVLINIQMCGHISGAHMNPVVTLAAVIWGKMSVALGIVYSLAQFSGALIGYGILMALSPIDLSSGVCVTRPHVKHTEYQALGIEIVLTVILVLVNCSVWDPINEKKIQSVSTMFGLIIAGLSIAGGPLTGAGMNPARSLAPAVWTNTWNSHWVYWIGPLLGSIAAVLFYKYIWLKVEKVEEPEVLTWTGSRNFVSQS
ncbi:unnamed protein product [Euphydryas editha]|uniref:Uncharacterized protein n=1 Tax=Euphydryas editha TaxID=104508 RepID=A0AAU9U7A4_EUPED|nr:unnamed protein product [Euphydryas editha]